MIPSSVWKYTSGWSNYPGMVKIQEILQRIMGNRGSKSSNVIAFFVKEQRIDGSHIGVWTTNKKKYINTLC